MSQFYGFALLRNEPKTYDPRSVDRYHHQVETEATELTRAHSSKQLTAAFFITLNSVIVCVETGEYIDIFTCIIGALSL